MDKNKVFLLYPGFHTVYGPYSRPDGRLHVILIGSDLKGNQIRRTVSYPKLLVEINLGKRLLDNETIDHQDRDSNNNNLSNFVVRPRSEHVSLDATRIFVENVNCCYCDKSFMPSISQIKNRSAQNTSGPFCSSQCSGKYGASVQNGAPKIEKIAIPVIHYKLDKI